MKKIIWADPAVIDLTNIHHYIAQDSSYYADVVCFDILSAIDRLQSFSHIGRIVPELKPTKIREIFVNDYRILYEASVFKITVLAIVHGKRLLKPAL